MATFAFLKTMGRDKYVQPLYRDLAEWKEKKPEAVTFFKENRNMLMAAVVDGVKKVLSIEE